MRKSSAILFIGAALVLSMFTQIRSVHAASCGYERLGVSDQYEVYLEYFPTVPVDISNPTASEEWAFKFYVRQKNIPLPSGYYYYYIPVGWTIEVYFRDDDCENNSWVEWKRWYPISMNDNRLPVSWSLSASCGPLSIGTTITLPDSNSFEPDYTKFPAYLDDGKMYMRVGYLKVAYNSNPFWNGATCEGAGSLGIPNDLAAKHLGHHIRMYFRFTMRWYAFHYLIPIKEYQVVFIVGDDIPATTDCIITVQQGTTSFSTGGCPYVPDAETHGIPPSRQGIGCGGSRTCMPL